MMAEQVLAAPDEAPGNPARPHVSLVLREETWHALRAARQPYWIIGQVQPRAAHAALIAFAGP